MKRFLLVSLLFLAMFQGRAYAQRLNSIEISLRKNVAYLTDSSMLGRGAGSEQEKRAAAYLYDQLLDAGVIMLTPETGEDFYIVHNGDTLHSQNVIGIVEGYDPKLRNEYVVVGAHYDHLGTSVLKRDGKEVEQIYYGADDNASGVATLIEVARQVASQHFMFRRSVIFALFGAEELGMMGSWYFLNRSFRHTDDIVAMINLDMVGRSGRDNTMQVYTADANVEMMEIINWLSGRALSIAPKYTPTDYFPSDHRNFYQKGIPVALFTSGTHRDYHTVRDTPDKLDYSQMEKLVEYVYSMAEVLANREERIRCATQVKGNGSKDGKETVYTQATVDKRATFLHGDEGQFLNRWVYDYIKYPDSAIRNGIEGRVIAEFIVGSDGKVRDVEIVRGLDDEIDAQVVKVIMASPKWKPAILRGKEVSVRVSVPVEFKLSKSGSLKIKK
ncbi:MAG: TonB family protein [Bacteroidales bacterium]|nr:TonB family protein [Bacteroidales bacterium]MBR2437876.1 TonB family protein [Bacteroidales bacterium]MBR4088435.1 TonB family protein [Bacteroidales bacterium]